MELTYERHRGRHWWECTRCRATWPTRIPDQADVETVTRPRIWCDSETVQAMGVDGITRPVEVMVQIGVGMETVTVDGYQPNRGAPTLTVCPNCNGRRRRFPRIRLVGRTPRPWMPNTGVDGDGDPRTDGHLDGEWGQWARIATVFSRKAQYQDRGDLKHSIIVRLAEVRNRKGEPLPEGAMIRTASYLVMEYWREWERNGTLVSLDAPIEDGDGDEADYRDTLADDGAIELDAWVDDRVWLQGCPKRLVEIAHKRVAGMELTHGERTYLWKWRKREVKQLRLGADVLPLQNHIPSGGTALLPAHSGVGPPTTGGRRR